MTYITQKLFEEKLNEHNWNFTVLDCKEGYSRYSVIMLVTINILDKVIEDEIILNVAVTEGQVFVHNACVKIGKDYTHYFIDAFFNVCNSIEA